MYDLNCPCCGTSYQGSAAGLCECCGYEFTEEYINELIAAEKKREQEIREKIAEEKRQQQLLLEQEEQERRKKEEAEKKAALAKARQDKKNELREKWHIAMGYSGAILTLASALTIIIKTIVMGNATGVIGGWIFFIIMAILSVIVSGFCYTIFNDDLTMSFTHIVPCGLIGAFVFSCTVSDLWKSMIVDLFEDSFFVALFLGWINVIIFLLLIVVALVVIVGITQVLTAYLQTKLDDTKGGFVGLAITTIAAFLYLFFFEQNGVSLVWGG